MERVPLSPEIFRLRIAILEEYLLTDCGYDVRISCTWRSPAHNAAVGGKPSSKHVLSPMAPIACDFVITEPDGILPFEVGSPPALHSENAARGLGLWAVYHDTGSGPHLHTQGLPPGEIAEWWRALYLENTR